ncbi:MAG: lamin tail domain-containing protein, partial [Clostridia bacterium]|nr:lamin tail domain-containing protein [Clostridia bacterium]
MNGTYKTLRRIVCAGFLLLCLFSAASAEVRINEVMAQNGTYTDGHAYDWVELYNDGKKAVDLSGWHLSDNTNKPLKWSFPEGAKIAGGGCVLVYCTGDGSLGPGKNKTFYADFKISSGGETLLLSDAGGNEADRMELPAQYGCVSYGRALSDGALGYFAEATPGKKNSASVCARRTERPVLLTAGGFYSGRITVTAQTPDGASLRYTVNGDTPTAGSKAFPAEGLTLSKTTPLRIRAFRDGEVPSETVSATYLINDEQLTPVICLTTDDKYLFNSKTGALVKGTGTVPNYEKEWEYPVNIEYYGMDGSAQINQMGTF